MWNFIIKPPSFFSEWGSLNHLLLQSLPTGSLNRHTLILSKGTLSFLGPDSIGSEEKMFLIQSVHLKLYPSCC